MDAAATIRTPLVQLARAALLTAIAGYLAIALSIFSRRIAGGLVPLAAPPLLLLAICGPAAMLLVQMLWADSRGRRQSAVDWFVRIAPTASALLVAAAVSLSGTSPPALAAVWLAIVAVEATRISRTLKQRPRALRPAPLAPRTTQSLVRQTAAETETITGELRASFRPGERIVFLHVAFCPPLASAPTIECEQTAGPEAEIKVSQRQTYGARFDVRLVEECFEICDVLISFAAGERGT